jgi:hypothetical protein
MATYTSDQIARFSAIRDDITYWDGQGKSIDLYWLNGPMSDKATYTQWVADGMPGARPKNVVPVFPTQSDARDKTFRKQNTSFAGADIVATFTPIGGKPMVIGEIQTISYSIYRPMVPVTALGQINAKGVVRGPRTIAGSLIFTVFDRHVLKEMMDVYSSSKNDFVDNYEFTPEDIKNLRQYAKTDEMPPFDINITFMNEYGSASTLNIYGIYIMTEGQTMSIEDMITENTMQYIAMDVDLMDYSIFTASSKSPGGGV